MDVIIEFSHLGDGRYSVSEYDPRSPESLRHAMVMMGWSLDQAVEYADFVVGQVRESLGNLFFSHGGHILRLRQVGDPVGVQELWEKLRRDVADHRAVGEMAGDLLKQVGG